MMAKLLPVIGSGYFKKKSAIAKPTILNKVSV